MRKLLSTLLVASSLVSVPVMAHAQDTHETSVSEDSRTPFNDDRCSWDDISITDPLISTLLEAYRNVYKQEFEQPGSVDFRTIGEVGVNSGIKTVSPRIHTLYGKLSPSGQAQIIEFFARFQAYIAFAALLDGDGINKYREVIEKYSTKSIDEVKKDLENFNYERAYKDAISLADLTFDAWDKGIVNLNEAIRNGKVQDEELIRLAYRDNKTPLDELISKDLSSSKESIRDLRKRGVTGLIPRESEVKIEFSDMSESRDPKYITAPDNINKIIAGIIKLGDMYQSDEEMNDIILEIVKSEGAVWNDEWAPPLNIYTFWDLATSFKSFGRDYHSLHYSLAFAPEIPFSCAPIP